MKAVKRGKNTFVHRRAYVAGDVTLGDGANIWCGACIRGDLAPVVIGRNSNVYPVSCVRGVIPENSIYKDKDHIDAKR